MKCSLCKNGETEAGKVTVTLHRNNSVIVIKEVPAQICNNCSDYFLTSEITTSLMRIAESAVKKGVEVEILKYVA